MVKRGMVLFGVVSLLLLGCGDRAPDEDVKPMDRENHMETMFFGSLTVQEGEAGPEFDRDEWVAEGDHGNLTVQNRLEEPVTLELEGLDLRLTVEPGRVETLMIPEIEPGEYRLMETTGRIEEPLPVRFEATGG